MQIERIYYPVKTLGYGNRIGIWTLGCPHRCPKCSNPELWDSNPAKDISIDKIIAFVCSIKGKVDGITITGGEPFLQAKELLQLIYMFNNLGIEDILVYTGYTLGQLKEMNNPDINEIIKNIAVLVDGQYVDELNDNKPLRGSVNQCIFFLKQKYMDKYKNCLDSKRAVQNIYFKNGLISIGIPVKDYRNEIKSRLKARGIIGLFEGRP